MTINCLSLPQKKNRVEWIDLTKAVAIIFVGIGHYGPPEWLHIWIYLFHMPLFFIVSGLTIDVNKYGFKAFLWRKIKYLIFPWFIGNVILNLFDYCCYLVGIKSSYISLLSLAKRLIVNINYGHLCKEYGSSFWFLTSLFVAELVCYALIKKISFKTLTAVEMCCIIVTIIYKRFISIYLAWDMDLLPMTIFFVLFGFLIKKYIFKIIKEHPKIIIFLISLATQAVGILIGILNLRISKDRIDFITRHWGIIPLYIIASILLCISALLVCTLLKGVILNFIGQNSLIFYLAYPITFAISDIVFSKTVPFYNFIADDRNVFSIILINIGGNMLAFIYAFMYRNIKNKLLIKFRNA